MYGTTGSGAVLERSELPSTPSTVHSFVDEIG
jgi:hypothetical protein